MNARAASIRGYHSGVRPDPPNHGFPGVWSFFADRIGGTNRGRRRLRITFGARMDECERLATANLRADRPQAGEADRVIHRVFRSGAPAPKC